ncbi:MAG: transposase, partial [Methanobrevibacter sp.]|nr:transposase [Candidatus Methanovirga basalitermitum]
MKYKLDKGSHSVYLLQYHFVQVVKYRKKVLKSLKTQDILKTNVINLSDNQNVTVLEIGIDED